MLGLFRRDQARERSCRQAMLPACGSLPGVTSLPWRDASRSPGPPPRLFAVCPRLPIPA